jgi:16S rRNA (cytosine967-C5)-methyltransferase
LSNNILQTAQIIKKVFNGRNLTDIFREIENYENLNILKALSYSVLRNYDECFFYYSQLVKKKNKSLEGIILLISFYQLIYSQHKHYNVVNNSVESAKKINKQHFVNGVLRNFLRNKEELIKTFKKNKFFLPKWWKIEILKNKNFNYDNYVAFSKYKPPLTIRLNFIDSNKYINYLDEKEISYTVLSNKAISFKKAVSINEIPLFKEGSVSVQDFGAQQILESIKFEKGSRVLDACASPGGKTIQILENEVALTAIDINDKRINLINENLKRVKKNAKVIKADIRKLDTWWDGKKYDSILLDAPCTSSGVLKRNPDIRFSRKKNDLLNLLNLQNDILDCVWRTLKVNGALIYSTCSVFYSENEFQINKFLKKNKNAKLVDKKHHSVKIGKYTDAFYFAHIIKS